MSKLAFDDKIYVNFDENRFIITVTDFKFELNFVAAKDGRVISKQEGGRIGRKTN